MAFIQDDSIQEASDNQLGQSVHTSKLAREITQKNIEGLRNINAKISNNLLTQ